MRQLQSGVPKERTRQSVTDRLSENRKSRVGTDCRKSGLNSGPKVGKFARPRGGPRGPLPTCERDLVIAAQMARDSATQGGPKDAAASRYRAFGGFAASLIIGRLTLSPRALRCDRNLLVVNFPSGLNTRQRIFFPPPLFDCPFANTIWISSTAALQALKGPDQLACQSLCVGHMDYGVEIVIIDLIRGVTPPFSPEYVCRICPPAEVLQHP